MRLDEKKKEHTEMAAEYDRNPRRYPSKVQLGQHCRNLAGYYSSAEEKASELARAHQAMAKQLEAPTKTDN